MVEALHSEDFLDDLYQYDREKTLSYYSKKRLDNSALQAFNINAVENFVTRTL